MVTLKDKRTGSNHSQKFHEELIQGLLGEDLWMITISGQIFRVKMLVKNNYFPPNCKLVLFLNTRGIFPDIYVD